MANTPPQPSMEQLVRNRDSAKNQLGQAATDIAAGIAESFSEWMLAAAKAAASSRPDRIATLPPDQLSKTKKAVGELATATAQKLHSAVVGLAEWPHLKSLDAPPAETGSSPRRWFYAGPSDPTFPDAVQNVVDSGMQALAELLVRDRLLVFPQGEEVGHDAGWYRHKDGKFSAANRVTWSPKVSASIKRYSELEMAWHTAHSAIRNMEIQRARQAAAEAWDKA
jgi:hypothetical protein